MNPTTKNDLRSRLAILTTLTLAGVASMATSPPDNSIPTTAVTLETAIPTIELSPDAPEVKLAIRVTGTSSAAIGGRFSADVSLESDAPAEVVTVFDPGGSREGDFASRTVVGASDLSVGGVLNGGGTIRVRLLGEGRVTVGGRAEIVVQVPEGSDTSPSAFSFDLEVQ